VTKFPFESRPFMAKPEEEIIEGFDGVESTEDNSSFIDEEAKDDQIPEEGIMGRLDFEE
jgi:hypothetical protein